MKKMIVLLFLLVMSALPIYSQTTTLDIHNNMYASTLTADSVWNGNWTNLINRNIASITVFVYSDSASATKGLKVYFSTDGATTRDSLTYTIGADSAASVIFTPYTEYYKLQYINGLKSSTKTTIQPIMRTEAKGF